MNAWIRKEIKDAMRWAPIGLVIHVLLVAYLFRTLTWYSYANLTESLFGVVWIAAGVFATLLGLVSFLPDTFGSARAYLIHRGISPEKIFVVRTLVGFVVYSATMLVPIGAIAVGLAWLGPIHAPVMPDQVIPSVFVVVFSFAFYLGASIVACRPARWYGTRLMPLAFAFVVSAAPMSILRFSMNDLLPAMVFPSLGCIGLYLLFITVRAVFARGASQPYPSRSWTLLWAEKVVFVASAVVLTLFLSIAALTSLPSIQIMRSYDVQFTSQGIPWLVEIESSYVRSYSQQIRALLCLQADGQAETSKPTSQELFPGLVVQAAARYFHGRWDMASIGSILAMNDAQSNVSVFAHRGRAFVYHVATTPQGTQQGRLLAVIGKDGVGTDDSASLSRFAGPLRLVQRNVMFAPAITPFDMRDDTGRSRANSMAFTLIDDEGVYQIDLSNQSITKVTDARVLGVASDSKRLAFFMEEAVEIYERANPTHGGGNSLLGDKIATLPIPHTGSRDFEQSLYRFAFVDTKNWTLVIQRLRRGTVDYEVLSSHEGQSQSNTTKAPSFTLSGSSEQSDREARFIGSLMAPGLAGAALAISNLMGDAASPVLSWFVNNLFFQALVSAVFAWLAARRRGLPWLHCLVWCAVAMLTGLFTWVAVLAIYPRVACVSCHACGKKRRLEEDRCRSCQAEWQPLAPLEIEMVGPNQRMRSGLDSKPVVQPV